MPSCVVSTCIRWTQCCNYRFGCVCSSCVARRPACVGYYKQQRQSTVATALPSQFVRPCEGLGCLIIWEQRQAAWSRPVWQIARCIPAAAVLSRASCLCQVHAALVLLLVVPGARAKLKVTGIRCCGVPPAMQAEQHLTWRMLATRPLEVWPVQVR